MHQISNPSILYFGTPVALVSTLNEDDSFNLAPLSSIFWLGYRCVIGIAAQSKTTENLLRNKSAVINLPSVNEVDAVNRLALTTGSNPIPPGKKMKGYRFVRDKFMAAGLTPQTALLVAEPRVKECPVQLEVSLASIHPLATETGVHNIKAVSMELKVLKVHLHKNILVSGSADHIDPAKWRPLIMSFQQFFGLGESIHPSTLASIPEEFYRTADTELAK